MRKRRRLLSAGVLLAAVIGVTACSTPSAGPTPVPTPTNVDLSEVEITDVDRNGVEYLSGQDVLDAVLEAIDDAGAVSAVGTFRERADPDGGGTTRRLSFTVAGTSSRFRADVTAADVAVSVVVADGRAFVTGNAALAAALGVPEADGGVVCLASDDPRVTAWSPAFSPAELLESMLGERSGVSIEPAADAATATDTAEFVIASAGSPIGSLTVSVVGPAVPLSLVVADPRGDADVSFTWGDVPAVTVPTEVAVPCS